MTVKPELSSKPPIVWLGAVALLPDEVEQTLEFLPEGSALRNERAKTAKRAAAKASELHRKPALED